MWNRNWENSDSFLFAMQNDKNLVFAKQNLQKWASFFAFIQYHWWTLTFNLNRLKLFFFTFFTFFLQKHFFSFHSQYFTLRKRAHFPWIDQLQPQIQNCLCRNLNFISSEHFKLTYFWIRRKQWGGKLIKVEKDSATNIQQLQYSSNSNDSKCLTRARCYSTSHPT